MSDEEQRAGLHVISFAQVLKLVKIIIGRGSEEGSSIPRSINHIPLLIYLFATSTVQLKPRSLLDFLTCGLYFGGSINQAE